MQTGSSGTLICWKSDQTTYVPPWDRMDGAWLGTQKRRGHGACFMFVFWSSVRITISAPCTLRQQSKQSGLSERTNEDV
jgi:hypothetical protein